MTPVERAIHRRTAQPGSHANEFGGRGTATRGAQAAAGNLAGGRNGSPRAGFQGMPRPGIFDRSATRFWSARGPKRGDICQRIRGAGIATRTADGNRQGVPGPARYRAAGDCTRFKKPARLVLRQSSGAPRLPVRLSVSLHREASPWRLLPRLHRCCYVTAGSPGCSSGCSSSCALVVSLASVEVVRPASTYHRCFSTCLHPACSFPLAPRRSCSRRHLRRCSHRSPAAMK
ncbi:hypothetical protein DFLDMN_003274 [Cupriavidus sp. H19C3]